MQKFLFLTPNVEVMTDDGDPVMIAGVRCRFHKGVPYAIQEQGNDALIAALRVGIDNGDFIEHGAAEGYALVAAYQDKRKAEKIAEKSGAGAGFNAPAGIAAATIDAGAQE